MRDRVEATARKLAHNVMEKIAFQFGAGGAGGASDEPALWDINRRLYDALRAHKDMIANHHSSKVWDWYKRVSNEYEFIFTSLTNLPSSAPFAPVSRSFFKLWEIMHDYDVRPQRPVKAAFLAEGPGGFIEAFWRLRNGAADELFAMTLYSHDRRVPQWKLPPAIMSQVHVVRGPDGTGSLYVPENIDALAAATGENQCDLVTADGGFDFSYNFNDQEVISMQLIFAEVYAAFRIQRPGGTFVLKVFDVSMPKTIALLHALTACYDVVQVVKPLTSRPANSEKYVVCQGFKGVDPQTMRWVACGMLGDAEERKVPVDFLSQVTELNLYSVTRQILYILKTIACIQELGESADKCDALLTLHSQLSRDWCATYDLLPACQTQTTCSES
jgi:hypothetical protein